MAQTSTGTQQSLTAEQILVGAEGALAAAGHGVSDPRLRQLLDRHARGELTLDEAMAAGNQIIDS